MLSAGIVGLPNVGKSTLFNAVTRTHNAPAENYPFCTIDPNVGVVTVPDLRLQKLAEISKSKKVTPTAIQFVDIAGLVKGASAGEGLGNQFRSEEHTSELQSHSFISYAVFCLKKKTSAILTALRRPHVSLIVPFLHFSTC